MEQAIQFEGTGLDLDSNLASMNPGDSPLRINCRVNSSQDSNKGGVQNFRGNTLITKKYGGGIFVQPNGNNQVIGSCKDVERDAIIYFVWNSLGNHQIRRYFTADNSIQLIMQSPLLNFKQTHKIIHADVINNILCWTDGWINPFDEFDYNPPRQIDISKAIGNTQGAPWPNGYPNIDNQVLDAIKYAPGLNPAFNYVNDPVFQDNRLYGHLFQFGYRWIYFDNSRSVVSPLSKLTLPQGEDVEGNYVQTVENRIDVTAKTGHFTVVRIELLVKENNAYRVVDSVEKYDENGGILIPSNADFTFQFFNTKFISSITAEEALRPFDYVPQCSGAQALIKSQLGARRVLSRNLEGYANIPGFDMSVSVELNKIDPEDLNYKNISWKRKGAYQIGVVYSDGAGRKSFVQANEETKATIPWWRDNAIIQQYYDPSDEWIISSHQKPVVKWTLSSQPPAWAKYYQIVSTNNYQDQQRLFGFYNWGACVGDKDHGLFQLGKETFYIPPQVGYDFQDGDRIRIVSQFSELFNLNVTRNSNAYLTPTEVATVIDVKRLGVTGELVTPTPLFPYQINNWQTYNDVTNKKWDFKITKFDPSTQRITINGDLDLDHRVLYRFEIYNPNTQISEENQRFFEIGESYEIINGQHSVQSGTLEGIDVFIKNELYTFTPVEFRIWANEASKTSTSDFVDRFEVPDMALGNAPIQYVFDTSFWRGVRYAPLPSNTKVTSQPTLRVEKALERDGEPTVQNSNSINGVYGLNNGSFLVNATLQQGAYTDLLLGFGTAVFYNYNVNGQQINSNHPMGPFASLIMTAPRCTDLEIKGVLVEDNSYSQYYRSNVNQEGRPYVISKEAVRRNYVAENRYGGAVVDNSLLNFFSTYYADDVVKLSESWNEITRVQTSGDTIKVRQRNKSTSIYVDRTETLNADGSSNLITADKVLGTTNSSVEVWGGTNGATDQMSVRDTYFFDAINGVVVRDATNGLVAISGNKESAADTFKMTSFFRDMGNYVRNNQEYIELHSIYDENTECYILTLRFIKERFMEGEDQIPAFMYKYKVSEAWNKGFTLCFNEPSNRWETFHQYVPEWYGGIGNTLLAFLDGQAYLMYSNEKHNNYFGVQYDTVCAIQSNQKPYTNYIRVYDNIDVYSNDIWYAKNSPDGEDIYILPSSNSPNGMVSELAPETFNAKEGVFHASFLKNKLTPGFPNELLALVDGDMLRGQAMKVVLRNSSENSVFMRQVIVHTTSSEMSG